MENLSPRYLNYVNKDPASFPAFILVCTDWWAFFAAAIKYPFHIIPENSHKGRRIVQKMFVDFILRSMETNTFHWNGIPALALKMIRSLNKAEICLSILILIQSAGMSVIIIGTKWTENWFSHIPYCMIRYWYIAYTGVPLITGLSFISNWRFKASLFWTHFPDPSIERDLFAYSTTQMLYNQFADFVLKYPDNGKPGSSLSLKAYPPLSRAILLQRLYKNKQAFHAKS